MDLIGVDCMSDRRNGLWGFTVFIWEIGVYTCTVWVKVYYIRLSVGL